MTATPKTRAEQVAAATAERRAVREWEKNGSHGRRPKTPALDAINAGQLAKPKPSGDGRQRRDVTVHFHHDGIAMPLTQNKLSNLAWRYTRGVAGPDRLGVEQLRKLLAKSGVIEPETSEWTVTLPNGITLSAVALPVRPAKRSRKAA